MPTLKITGPILLLRGTRHFFASSGRNHHQYLCIIIERHNIPLYNFGKMYLGGSGMVALFAPDHGCIRRGSKMADTSCSPE